MPGVGATDPAGLIEEASREAGHPRQLQQQRRVALHPPGGGLTGHPFWYREEQLANHQNN